MGKGEFYEAPPDRLSKLAESSYDQKRRFEKTQGLSAQENSPG